ncbi:uncharacterized protein CTRU02_211241 [Colletotrichum truncatum]|uniref:Uncharacterized protein n=1 Tax=Colletotrichum truncatum TaxID=5467 RepID=A0ACC3YTF9_COLTU|nr:uncharacterized protein CTRU02_02020 [Colletotrichum truncatum]KAF6799149.1 hypothetical protein CTRU02_02020 [Colletotrichum truncatum]
MADTENEEIPQEYVKIYLLTKLTPSEEANYLKAISEPVDGFDDSWLHPQLVEWTSKTDGTLEKDMLHLYKKREAEREREYNAFYYFADRKSVDEGSTILVDRDFGTSELVKEAGELLFKLASDNGIELPAVDWSNMDDELEGLVGEMVSWGVAWGRERGPSWKSSWTNLDIGNMNIIELVELHGGEVKLLMDPDWDCESLLTRLRTYSVKTRENELQAEHD